MTPVPDQKTVSAALGAFGIELDEVPPAVRHEAKRALINMFGCALGAAQAEPVTMAVTVLGRVSGPPIASLIGRRERFDILNASFVNAIAANLFDFDDTHLATVIHPTAPVAPPALAIAEERHLSGKALIQAVVAGIEIECRVGLGVSPGHYDRGWHITATCGVFGAAAAAARLLGLSASQCADALGIAASLSSGVIENLSTAAKNVGVGNAARNGLLAALMAEAGYPSAPQALEGGLGWAAASGDKLDRYAVLDRLGERWELLSNTYKPYPSGIVFHAIIDACLALREGIDPAAIRQVEVSGDELMLARGDRPVLTERDARVSIHHAAAVTLLYGRAGEPEFSADAVRDPAIAALRSRVAARLDSNLPRGAARVRLETADGHAITSTILHARGSAEHPLSDADLEAKMAASITPESGIDAGRLIESLWNIESTPDVARLMQLARS